MPSLPLFAAGRVDLLDVPLDQPPPQVTGERAGHVVVASILGTVIVRASEREVRISEAEADRANAYLRFMLEMGENWI